MTDFISTLPTWIWGLAGFALAVTAGLLASSLIRIAGKKLEGFGSTIMLRLALRRIRASASALVGVLSGLAIIPATGLTPETQTGLARLAIVVGVIAIGIAGIRLTQLGFDIYARRIGGSVEDVQVRRRQTRLNLLRRLAVISIAVTSVALVFLSLPTLRTLGISLFASAGVAGIAIGLAARPAIANLLAGVQIAFSEPIRIGDQVVIEGEWGTVEDITSTYVVINIWDQRRMILPLAYFLEKPFQNWTRESPQILGTSMFYVDYSVPVEEMREQLRHILENTSLWDGRAMALQVTDCRTDTVEIRALMSARNAGGAFELRCHVREKMIEWLRCEYPHALPRTRYAIDQKVLEVPGVSYDIAGKEDARKMRAA